MNVAQLTWKLNKDNLKLPEQVRKRNGALAPFDVNRIERAVQRCFDELETDTEPGFTAAEIAERVSRSVASKYSDTTPSVEQVQDLVETTLIALGEGDAARAYIHYRIDRAHERSALREVPEDVRDVFEEDNKYFTSSAQLFMYYDKYSRFNWELERRETWHETVDRTIDHLKWEVEQHKPGAISDDDFNRLHAGILNMKIMPSMRLLAMAGEAAQRNSMSIYNCSYLPVKDIQAFVEAMLISMAGCGVGFSVERDYIEQFPRIKRQKKHDSVPFHVIEDTTEGWAEALRVGLETWWNGGDVQFDPSMIRKAGSVLKTKGGRASGPDPLMALLAAARSIVLSRQGQTLRSVDAQLLMCWVGEAAVQGGVRRTAMISLFDWDDHEMRTIKDGARPEFATTLTGENVLWNSNNSAVWPEDISDVDIAQQMLDMVKARSGEPGIFSRAVANKTKPRRRKRARFGTNPCGEILLREFGFCNLSQAVARAGDTVEDLREKVELATLVGVIQSLSTRFPGLRDEWKRNCEEERLLGVDLTAQADNELLQFETVFGEELRDELREYSLEVATRYAEALEIAIPAAISTNKPAGNSAELLDAANGIHKRKARRYKRRYTVGVTSPLYSVLRACGVPMEPRAGSTEETATKWIATFPKKSPDGAPLISDASVIDQLNFWLLNKRHWTEHNPSCTITYRKGEVMDMIKWVVDHKNEIGGLSFFPEADAIYAQPPFEEVTDEEYEQLVIDFPAVDYALVYAYERDDMTEAAQQLACFSGDASCSLA